MNSQRRNRGGEFGNIALILIPTNDKAHLAVGPIVEVKALGAQFRGFVWRHAQEQFIRLNGMEQPHAGRCREHLRFGVRRARIGEPAVILKQRLYLRREIAALGQQMPRALAPLRCCTDKFRLEEDQRLGTHPAVFDETEGENIDPRAPCYVRW